MVTFSFDRTSYTVPEAESSVVVCVTVTSDIQLARPVQIMLKTVDETATGITIHCDILYVKILL